MITGRFGRHEVLLPSNHNYNKFCDNLGFFFKLKHKKRRNEAYCRISAEIRTVDSQSDLRILFKF